MKHSKKILSSVLILLAAVLLVSCKKEDAKAPVISGATDKTVDLGAAFDPKEGVTATDEVDGNLTDSIVITGTVDTDTPKVYTLNYSVENKAGKKASVDRKITVIADVRNYAEGAYNYKFALPEVRNAFFGAAEDYLLENVYGGVPLFVNSGYSIYSSRVKLPVENYVPVMGWGSKFGELTQDDSKVKFSDGSTGLANNYTYRGAFSSNPTTLNQWLSDDSVSSDAASFMLDSLYDFQYNADKTGYEVVPSMANAMPTATGSRVANGVEVAKKWSVPIRTGLEFKFHPDTTGTYNKDITAESFVDTYKYAIDQGWFRAIGGGSHFWSTSTPVKGAKAYYDAKGSGNWDDVGIKVSADGNSLEFEFDIELSEWNLTYWLSSNTLTPVPLDMAKALGTSYGTTPQTTAYTGAYYLHTYEKDKSLVYATNDKFHTPSLYKYTGYNFTIIERSEIIFAEFEAGKLDAAGVPTAKFDQYKGNTDVKASPGATTFRMNINGLGTAANQVDKFPNSRWSPEAILSNKEFRQAMYFGVDRKTLAKDVLKVSDPGMFLFGDAYFVDPLTNTPFRDTDQGQAIAEKYSFDTQGYVPDAARDLFLSAVEQGIAAGDYKRGTAANPTVINLEIAIQAASTSQEQLGNFIKKSFENLFHDTTNHVKVEFTVLPVAFPDIYYTKQLVGDFDLGMGGISGSSLDAASFLEVFSSDNRGGFTLNWGFDTSVADIPVKYTKPGETTEVTEYWSFDAIISVLNGDVNVSKGREAIDNAAVTAVNQLIAALPAAGSVTLEHEADVKAAVDAYNGLASREQDLVVGVDKLVAANNKIKELVSDKNVANVKASIAALPEEVVKANEKAVKDTMAAYNKLTVAEKAKITADETTKLADAYAQLTDILINEVPANVTMANKNDIDALNAMVKQVKTLRGRDNYGIQIPSGVINEAQLDVITDEKAVQDVIDLINDLKDRISLNENADGEVDGKVQLTDKARIDIARNAYINLESKDTNKLRDRVTNRDVLFGYDKELTPLVDAYDALVFELLVDALPSANDITDVHSIVVEAARDNYNKLSAGAKKQVKPNSLAKLVELEEVLGL